MSESGGRERSRVQLHVGGRELGMVPRTPGRYGCRDISGARPQLPCWEVWGSEETGRAPRLPWGLLDRRPSHVAGRWCHGRRGAGPAHCGTCLRSWAGSLSRPTGYQVGGLCPGTPGSQTPLLYWGGDYTPWHLHPAFAPPSPDLCPLCPQRLTHVGVWWASADLESGLFLAVWAPPRGCP